MQISFWGVRGSTPTPAFHTWRYGGNTPSVEVRAGEQLIILDAGTGIRDLGHQLCLESPPNGLQAALLFSHYHWDHVQGLPFFEPLYFQGNAIHIFGPRPQGADFVSLQDILQALFHGPFFPVTTSALKADYPTQELDVKSDFTLGPVRVRTCLLNHPQGSLAYRLEHGGVSVVYASDHEPGDADIDRALRQFARGADLLIADAQYRPEQLGAQKAGWGHGSWDAAVRMARAAEVRHLVLFHHEPLHSDEELDDILEQARQAFPQTWSATEGMQLDVSREGIQLGNRRPRISQRTPVQLPVEVETRQDGVVVREVGRLENISMLGAYFLSPRSYAPHQPVEISIPLQVGATAKVVRPGAPTPFIPAEFRLRGYVLRTEPQTTNGHWIGVAVHFPGRRTESGTSPTRAEGEKPEAPGGEVLPPHSD
ncbi:MAG: MBL fold metallo-hydrolase [Acidobacteria bacterium]|nr:MBL fold metallo-hydrolase [Acidobacteriota bacterium]